MGSAGGPADGSRVERKPNRVYLAPGAAPAPFKREALSSVGSLWLDMLSPIFPWESRESYEVFCAVQKAAEAKAELLRAQLVESDGRVIAELEELRCRLGQTLDFVGACNSFLAERLDNVPCRVRGVGFSVR